MYILQPNDFPIYCVGPLVYCRSLSSALFVAPNDVLAADIANRLNRDHLEQSGRITRPEPMMTLTLSLPALPKSPVTVFPPPAPRDRGSNNDD